MDRPPHQKEGLALEIARRFRGRWALGCAVAVVWVLGMVGCGEGASECDRDGDCSGEEVCVRSGGLVFGGGLCVLPEAFDGDAGADADALCEPTTCQAAGAAACAAIDDGCGGHVACGAPGCIADLAAGRSHSCAVLGDGTFYCWGANDSGQLGSGSTTSSPTPVLGEAADDGFAAQKIAAGSDHTCVIDPFGEAWCWGDNRFGQLGTGEGATQLSELYRPQAQVDLSGVGAAASELEIHLNTSCAITSDDAVYCWGLGTEGQLGDGQSRASHPAPVLVEGLGDRVYGVGLSVCYGCAATADGIGCWGSHDDGCGGGASPHPASLIHPVALDDAATIAGGSAHTCYSTPDGAVFCFNDNSEGQLGIDPATAQSSAPVEVAGLAEPIVEVVAGASHSCALGDQGGVFCWGDNSRGQLGDGQEASSFEPVAVALSGPADDITAGVDHSCAALASGDIECWGDNSDGQLGDADAASQPFSSSPVAVQW
jgi:alpha-tubulin suppressor-like RCC1 family protein